jgi:RNA polymerase sigma-70 factor (ECF subfamily)
MEQDSDKPTPAQLIREHYESVYRFARHLSQSTVDAEDLVQQTFLIACRKLADLREASRTRSWLFSITRNLFLKERLKHKERWDSSELEESLQGEQQHSETPEQLLEQRLEIELLQVALAELPDAFRIPLLMYYFEDLSYKEIGEALDLPLGTVMSRLARGKEHLRARLAAEYETLPATPAIY